MNDQATLFDKKGITIATNPAIGNQDGAGFAICNGKHIQYAIQNSTGSLAILTTDSSLYQNTGIFSNLNNWRTTIVSELFPRSMSIHFK